MRDEKYRKKCPLTGFNNIINVGNKVFIPIL